MRRREFIKAFAASFAAVPCSVRAQQPGRTPLIAVLLAFDQNDTDGQRYAAVFRETLRQAGWNPGTDVRVEFRWRATDAERATAGATEILALRPDVIVPHATIATRAVVQQTRAIPVVFTNVSDPIGENFVQSFSNPGGNITGFTNIEPSMGSKYVELLKTLAPDVRRAGMIYNPKSTPGNGSYFYDPFATAASVLAVQPIRGEVADIASAEQFIEKLAQDSGGGLIVVGEPFTNLHRAEIIALASRFRLPTICPYRIYANSGCLASYGIDLADQFRRAATYAERNLKGTSRQVFRCSHQPSSNSSSI
jgi:putative ABC transport system substrate-binding protein